MRTFVADTPTKVGETVTVKGWVNARRDHGGLIFIDVRDHTGVAQLAIRPEQSEAFALAEQLRAEFVISATGAVVEREEALRNPNLPTGTVEIKLDELTILNRSEALPIQVMGDAIANEDLRLKYRFLDLRRPKMQYMLKKRAEYYSVMRSYLEEREFIEVTTPILANSSPEGARDFLIPSRVHPGKFYALPQAPQQFKQLLMVGGLPRYYQMAACFRDEDPRADRLYGEFYQLDLEMSFVEDGEEVRSTMEPLIKQLSTEFAGKRLLSEDIPRIPYVEAMEKYGSDKPDLRYGMELIELTKELKGSEFGVFANAECVKAICVKGASELSRSQIDNFTEIAKREGAGGLAYLTYEGGEVKSPIAKFLKPEELEAIRTKTGAEDGDVVFFGADKRGTVNKVLGKLRIAFADHFGNRLGARDQVPLTRSPLPVVIDSLERRARRERDRAGHAGEKERPASPPGAPRRGSWRRILAQRIRAPPQRIQNGSSDHRDKNLRKRAMPSASLCSVTSASTYMPSA